MHKIRTRKNSRNNQLKTSSNLENLCPQMEVLCQKWTIVALLDFNGYQKVFTNFRGSAKQYIDFLQLDLQTNEMNEFDDSDVVAALKNRQEQLANMKWVAPRNDVFYKNLISIQAQFQLNTNELNVLLFTCLLTKSPELADALNALGDLSNHRLFNIMSGLLNLNLQQLSQILSTTGKLYNSGLVQIDNTRDHCFINKLDLLPGLSDSIVLPQIDTYDLFVNNFVPAPAATLAMQNYSHLGSKISLVQDYLKFCLQEKSLGVNILVYGPPGTGKTEFSRMLAQTLKANLFEVAVENKHKHRIPGAMRLNSYRLSQTILASLGKTILVFDEMEDIDQNSRDENMNTRASYNGNKAWFNQMLEKNPIPTIWITNNIDFLDKAHLRRFDYYLELDIPPQKTRAQMLQDLTQASAVSSQWCYKMAENESLSPAIMTRAIKVANAIKATGKNQNIEQLLTDVIGSTMQAMNDPIKTSKVSPLELNYGINFVNTDYDMGQLLDSLKEFPEGRICLYGPPGTGKTAFAKNVAKTLGKEAMVKKASDIFAPHVGETERNMAMIFKQATEQNAVLILDEADSFLRSRQFAKHNWEVNAINEMLTQLENFNGLFFASTNLMEQLDEASLRRFDCKIKFDFLKPEQTMQLIQQTCKLLNIQETIHLIKVETIPYLTAGDFATILRQSRLRPIVSVAELMTRLKAEVSVKKQYTAPSSMGFLALSA